MLAFIASCLVDRVSSLSLRTLLQLFQVVLTRDALHLHLCSAILLILIHSGIDDLLVRNRDVPCGLLKVKCTDVREWRVQNLLFVLQSPHLFGLGLAGPCQLCLFLADSAVKLDWTWVINFGDACDVIVTKAVDVHSVVFV